MVLIEKNTLLSCSCFYLYVLYIIGPYNIVQVTINK